MKLDKETGSAVTMIEVGNGLHFLQVYQNGFMRAYKWNDPVDSRLGFNARKVMMYLDILNVEMG